MPWARIDANGTVMGTASNRNALTLLDGDTLAFVPDQEPTRNPSSLNTPTPSKRFSSPTTIKQDLKSLFSLLLLIGISVLMILGAFALIEVAYNNLYDEYGCRNHGVGNMQRTCR